MDIKEKDFWDKLEVILTPLGGFLTALTIAIVGILGSQFLEKKQAIESNVRLYAEIMSSREKADSSLRREMFNTAIQAFLSANPEEPKEKLLKLELLAYNFHNALDLGPLFEHLFQEFQNSNDHDADDCLKRLESMATEVNTKQIAILEAAGQKIDGEVDLDELKRNPGSVIEESSLGLNYNGKKIERIFEIEALTADHTRKKLLIRLSIWRPNESDPEVDYVFWVGLFDFPTIRNMRLSNGDRCSVVLKKFKGSSAQVSLVYFPGSRASLKEKPYYDEIVQDLLGKRDP